MKCLAESAEQNIKYAERDSSCTGTGITLDSSSVTRVFHQMNLESVSRNSLYIQSISRVSGDLPVSNFSKARCQFRECLKEYIF